MTSASELTNGATKTNMEPAKQGMGFKKQHPFLRGVAFSGSRFVA